jgi:hypothetical protein
LSNDDLELKNVGFIHFLQQYFFIYGRQANATSTSYIRKDEMDRFGAGLHPTANIFNKIFINFPKHSISGAL